MAIINCWECKKEVSTQANLCPHCGVKQPNSSSILQKFAMLVFVSFLLFTAYFIFIPKSMVDKNMERARSAIELCWQDYERKSNSSSEKEFIAKACENMESEFKLKFNRTP